jgi:hypothetical protein
MYRRSVSFNPNTRSRKMRASTSMISVGKEGLSPVVCSLSVIDLIVGSFATCNSGFRMIIAAQEEQADRMAHGAGRGREWAARP